MGGDDDQDQETRFFLNLMAVGAYYLFHAKKIAQSGNFFEVIGILGVLLAELSAKGGMHQSVRLRLIAPFICERSATPGSFEFNDSDAGEGSS